MKTRILHTHTHAHRGGLTLSSTPAISSEDIYSTAVSPHTVEKHTYTHKQSTDRQMESVVALCGCQQRRGFGGNQGFGDVQENRRENNVVKLCVVKCKTYFVQTGLSSRLHKLLNLQL